MHSYMNGKVYKVGGMNMWTYTLKMADQAEGFELHIMKLALPFLST